MSRARCIVPTIVALGLVACGGSDDSTFGNPNGQPCPINSQQPVNCVPALTR